MKFTIEKIKLELINSCSNSKTIECLPFLLSEKVKTGMPNKIRFYKTLKNLIKSTKKNTKGKLTLRIKNIEKNEIEEKYYLNFYDKLHKNSQLTIEVRERKREIYFDTIPF